MSDRCTVIIQTSPEEIRKELMLPDASWIGMIEVETGLRIAAIYHGRVSGYKVAKFFSERPIPKNKVRGAYHILLNDTDYKKMVLLIEENTKMKQCHECFKFFEANAVTHHRRCYKCDGIHNRKLKKREASEQGENAVIAKKSHNTKICQVCKQSRSVYRFATLTNLICNKCHKENLLVNSKAKKCMKCGKEIISGKSFCSVCTKANSRKSFVPEGF